MTSTQAGIALLLASTTANAVGTLVQKRALDHLPPLEGQGALGAVRTLLGHPGWLLGWLLTTVGLVLNLAALGKADLTLLQPLHGFGLVVLASLSHFWLQERVRARELCGIAIAIAGVAWLGLGAPQVSVADGGTLEVPARVSSAALSPYASAAAFVWYAIVAVLIAAPWLVSVRRRYRGAGVAFAIVAAAFSVAGFTFAKGPSAFVSAHGVGVAASSLWVWLLALAWLTCSMSAIVLQQVSLQKGRAVVAVPVFNLVSMVLPLVPGALVFDEALTTQRLAAVAVILAGAALLGAPERPAPTSA